MHSEPTPNLPLLRRVLRQIDAFPETWNQNWCGIRDECGTTHCIAGHALELAGVPLRWEKYCEAFAPMDVVYRTANGAEWSDAAQLILGLTDDEVEYLFSVGNSREMIEGIATEIAARVGEELWPEPITFEEPIHVGQEPCLV